MGRTRGRVVGMTTSARFGGDDEAASVGSSSFLRFTAFPLSAAEEEPSPRLTSERVAVVFLAAPDDLVAAGDLAAFVDFGGAI
jgi:hypothetical protein